MRDLAKKLLKQVGSYDVTHLFGGSIPESDVDLLAADLAGVTYDTRIDGPYAANCSTEELFLRRLGGIGALGRYMKCIRPKGARQ